MASSHNRRGNDVGGPDTHSYYGGPDSTSVMGGTYYRDTNPQYSSSAMEGAYYRESSSKKDLVRKHERKLDEDKLRFEREDEERRQYAERQRQEEIRRKEDKFKRRKAEYEAEREKEMNEREKKMENREIFRIAATSHPGCSGIALTCSCQQCMESLRTKAPSLELQQSINEEKLRFERENEQKRKDADRQRQQSINDEKLRIERENEQKRKDAERQRQQSINDEKLRIERENEQRRQDADRQRQEDIRRHEEDLKRQLAEHEAERERKMKAYEKKKEMREIRLKEQMRQIEETSRERKTGIAREEARVSQLKEEERQDKRAAIKQPKKANSPKSLEVEKKIQEMEHKLRAGEGNMQQVGKETAEKIQRIQEIAAKAAHKRGQQNAVVFTNAVRQTYERGVRDGMTCFKEMLERAGNKENAVVIVHDTDNSSTGIAGKLENLFKRYNFIVPPPVSENEEMPECNIKCRLKWLVLYFVFTDELETPLIRDNILKASRYFDQTAFRDCSKLAIFQCRGVPAKCDISEALRSLRDTPAIVSWMSEYHSEVVEGAFRDSKSFEDTVRRLKMDAKFRQSCLIKE